MGAIAPQVGNGYLQAPHAKREFAQVVLDEHHIGADCAQVLQNEVERVVAHGGDYTPRRRTAQRS